MMGKSFRIGPGAASLMLVIVVVALSLLALLSLMDARSDHMLTERSIDFAAAEQRAAADAQWRLAELDSVLAGCKEEAQDDSEYLGLVSERLPEGMKLVGDIVNWEQPTPNGRVLMCAVRILPLNKIERYSWVEHIFMGNNDMF